MILAAGGPAEPKAADPLDKGRRLYNNNCYFCHGYNGDGETVAAAYLDPKPRNLKAAADLTQARILAAIEGGRPGSAMKSFKGRLAKAEMEDIARYVFETFVRKKSLNTFYHTPENGWFDHEKRYGAAFPFVRGERPADPENPSLNAGERAGLALFLGACVSCHEAAAAKPEPVWDKFPLSQHGCGVTCHADGTIHFPWAKSGERPKEIPADPYAAHGIPPKLADLSPAERRGEKLYQDNCAFCHAMDGTGGNWIGSFLQPHPRNLIDPQAIAHLDEAKLLQAIRKGLPNTSMPAWDKVLPESDIQAIGAYVQRAFFGPARNAGNVGPAAR